MWYGRTVVARAVPVAVTPALVFTWPAVLLLSALVVPARFVVLFNPPPGMKIMKLPLFVPAVPVSAMKPLNNGACSMNGRTAVPQPQLTLSSLNSPTGNLLYTSWYACRPIPNCFRLFVHLARAAASRTFCTAGRSRPMRIAMIAITTSSSISVNALRLLFRVWESIETPLRKTGWKKNLR